MQINAINTVTDNYKNKNNNTKNMVQYSQKPFITSHAQAFLGKKDDISWLERLFGKYSEFLYEKKWMQKLVDKCTKNKEHVIEAIQILGSLITSGVYVSKTLNKKDLDDDARRTLAINQALCFVIPTIGALTVDEVMKNWAREQEYKYSAKQEHKRALAKLSPEEFAESLQKQSERLKGLRKFTNLVTFVLMYRYVTPVLVTPIANAWGAKRNARRKAEAAAKLAQQQNENSMVKQLPEDKNVANKKAV